MRQGMRGTSLPVASHPRKRALIDSRKGALFGGRARAFERLASLVKPDTRVVPADGLRMTGCDIVRQRDIHQQWLVTMVVVPSVQLRIARAGLVAQYLLRCVSERYHDDSA